MAYPVFGESLPGLSSPRWQRLPVHRFHLPAELFGGTWEQIKDRFLLAAGDSHAAGSTGGEATHTLTKAELPDHTHTLKYTGQSVTEGVNAIRLYQAASYQYNAYSGGQSSDCEGQAHNNMPPYLAVYTWRRTA